MDEDQLFLFADETIDHLNAALDKARQVKETARSKIQQQHLGPYEVKKLRVLARDIRTNIDDAGTAAEAVLGEVQSL